jgi:hypothetical protein
MPCFRIAVPILDGRSISTNIYFVKTSIPVLVFFPLFLAFAACASTKEGVSTGEAVPQERPPLEFFRPPEQDGPPPSRSEAGGASFQSRFDEIWAYLVQGRENALRPGLPISDLGYFGAEVDSYGKLASVPNPADIPPFNGRVHMVVKCDGYSLTHFVLKRGSPERRELIADLLAAAGNFDGLQIDFEYIPVRDRELFFSFLEELQAGLKNKIFTAALKARTRALNNDVHDYARIAPLVDRILIMAYDEHWGGSPPGPVASIDWCRNTASYALSVIGREKLIMGLPFYGRVWIEPSPARAYTYPQIETLIKENSLQEIQWEKGIPNFEYEIPVRVKGYYENTVSLGSRLRMYHDMAVRAVGFWRLGQEDSGVWDILSLDAE